MPQLLSLHGEDAFKKHHPQLPATTGGEFLSRNMRAVAPRNTTQPTFSPRHLQHPNCPGIQSTSTAGQSDASHLASTFAKCSATDSPQGPGRAGTPAVLGCPRRTTTRSCPPPHRGIWQKKRGFFQKVEHPLLLCTSPSTPGVLPASEKDKGHGSCYFLLMIPGATLGF